MKLCCINIFVIVVGSFLLSACRENVSVNVPELSDGDPTTCYTGIGLFLILNTVFLSKVIKSIHQANHRYMTRQAGY